MLRRHATLGDPRASRELHEVATTWSRDPRAAAAEAPTRPVRPACMVDSSALGSNQRRPSPGWRHDVGKGTVSAAVPGTVNSLAPRDGTLPAGGFCSATSGAAAARA